jgi:hypothetical protein
LPIILAESELAANYLPLDLSGDANAGPKLRRGEDGWRWVAGGPLVRGFGTVDPPSLSGFPTGRRRFWGVPFVVTDPATNNGNCWIVLSADPTSRLPRYITPTLPTPTRATALVFAYCTDIDWPDGRIGDRLATYTIVRANGDRLSWTIRRRFEIGPHQPSIGAPAYAAVRHDEPGPMRTVGASMPELTGLAASHAPQFYWLWEIENPEPDGP